MMKFAKTKYFSFKNRFIGLSVKKDEVFAVTKEIEAMPAFQEGVATKNITFVQINNTHELSEVVNLTDAIKAEFMGQVAVKPEPVPEPTPEPEAEAEPEAEEVPALSFTEEAGNVKKALEAISKETDIDKLEFAQDMDERKSVKKAIKKRIEELN